MSQSKIRSYINIASFKLNRISLLNQSQFNPLIPRFYNINNNMNLFQLEKKKENPLTKKNKIIKKHNILKKIDFYINTNQANHIFPKAIFEPMTNNNMRLPILAYNNNRILNYSKKNNNDFSKAKLYQNNSMRNSNSFTFNSILSKNNYSNSNKNNYNFINYNDMFENDSSKSFKPSFSDKEIQTTDDLRTPNNEYKIKNKNNSNSNLENKTFKIIIKSKLKCNEKNENDSSDDFDYKKDLEKIITTKSKPNIQNLSGINNKYFSTNNSKNLKKIKTNYILLKNLYKIKSFKNDKTEPFHQTEQNMKLMAFKNKKIDKNLLSKFNIIPRINNLSLGRPKLIRLNKYPKKILTKNAFYDLINQSFESKNQNSINNGNQE